uniref:WW domain-containing protein n=1 Tax=Salix viminalis TaxID=40686 RepID=A0A6N2MVG5_SALVM
MQSQVMGQTWKGRSGNGEKTCGGYIHKTELTELSLAPTRATVLEKSRNNSSSSSESENTPSRKRKLFSDPFQVLGNGVVPVQASVDLHARSPLPLDWEQCLDLEVSFSLSFYILFACHARKSLRRRMYYLNKKTLKKSWSWPKNQKLDLELNMSTIPNCPDQWNSSRSSPEESDNKNHASRNSNMVALACSNCHLLVILSKSSPSCPNCKYLHSFRALRSPQKKVSPARSLSTLRLLN